MLFDVVEDSNWIINPLRKEGFPEVIIDVIDSVTWIKWEDYEDFIRSAANNPMGRRVKIAELRDN